MSGDQQARIDQVKSLIGAHEDFPKKGIVFRDIFPMLKDPKIFRDCISLMVEHINKECGKIDVVFGLDSRGFIFGPLIALELGVSFQPIRKAGKLPGETVKCSYTLEYGTDVFEAQKDAVEPGQRAIIVDDLIATGGSMRAACQLVEKDLKAELVECLVVIELSDLKGREKVPCKNFYSMIQFEGE